MYENQVETVMSTIVGCGKQLQRWVEVLEHSHPLHQHNIPDTSSMNIGKLVSGSVLLSQIHAMGQGRRAVLLLSKLMKLRKICANKTLMTSVL